jgi:hypothetical protein
MQQIHHHLISLIDQIIKSKEIYRMENHVLAHYQIFIPNHLIIMHVFGMMRMIIIHMTGVIHHIQQKEMMINQHLIYHYQKQ